MVRGLNASGEVITSWSTILSFVISRLLDNQTKMDWKNSLTHNSKYSDAEALMKLLETKILSDDVRTRTFRLKKKSSWSNFPKKSYAACEVSGCFLTLEVIDRMWEILQFDVTEKNGLYINCFVKGHNLKECIYDPSAGVAMRNPIHCYILIMVWSKRNLSNPMSLSLLPKMLHAFCHLVPIK